MLKLTGFLFRIIKIGVYIMLMFIFGCAVGYFSSSYLSSFYQYVKSFVVKSPAVSVVIASPSVEAPKEPPAPPVV